MTSGKRWRRIGAIGFYIVGLALLGWYIAYAFSEKTLESGEVVQPWEMLRSANVWLLGGMFISSAASLFLNATMFWLTIRPVQDVGFWNMQRLNALGTAFNYLPLRPGLIMRIAYHVRVDRLSILQVGAWFAAMATVMLLVIGVCAAAVLIRREIDVLFVLIMLAGLFIGGWATYFFFGNPLIVRYGRGADRMLRNHRVLWPLIGLRLLDVIAFSVRVGCAAAIVGVDFPSGGHVLLLGLAALLLRLLPVQLGFREVLLGVAATAVASADVDASFFALLAVIESAGEGLVVIPLGGAALFWYRRKWSRERAHKEAMPA